MAFGSPRLLEAPGCAGWGWRRLRGWQLPCFHVYGQLIWSGGPETLEPGERSSISIDCSPCPNPYQLHGAKACCWGPVGDFMGPCTVPKGPELGPKAPKTEVPPVSPLRTRAVAQRLEVLPTFIWKVQTFNLKLPLGFLLYRTSSQP